MKSLRDYYVQVDEPNPIAPTILSRFHGTKSEVLKLKGQVREQMWEKWNRSCGMYIFSEQITCMKK